MMTTMQEIRSGAIARVQGRRHPPEFRNVMGSDGQMGRVQVDTPERLRPVNAAEWLDDRIAAMPPVRGAEFMFALAEAARDGVKAAVAAVAGARDLTALGQYVSWCALAEWAGRDPHQDARPILAAIRAEWQRLRLRTDPPEVVEARIIDVNKADLDRSEALRRGRTKYPTPWGIPAGVPSWAR